MLLLSLVYLVSLESRVRVYFSLVSVLTVSGAVRLGSSKSRVTCHISPPRQLCGRREATMLNSCRFSTQKIIVHWNCNMSGDCYCYQMQLALLNERF